MGGKSRKRGQVSKKLIDRLLKQQSQGGESKKSGKSGQSKKQKGLL